MRMEEGRSNIVKPPPETGVVKIDDHRTLVLNDDVSRMQVRMDEPERVDRPLAHGKASDERAGGGRKVTLLATRQTRVTPEAAPGRGRCKKRLGLK